jgi:hypothetical protein
MKYQPPVQGASFPYPQNNIDPAEKDTKWGMAYAKAAYNDWAYGMPKGIFANNGGDYQKFKLYAQGKQPIGVYKKILNVDEQTDNTWLSVDWTVRPIVSTYRDRALSRLMKQKYEVIATPIDIMAKAELDVYYSDLKAKMSVRELMQKTNPELAQHPLLAPISGEPLDMEELEMRIQNGEQFNRAMDAEMAIALGFYENGFEKYRKGIYEDLFDLGVAGYKEWLGDDNKAKFRKVNPENIVTSVFRQCDGSDVVHAGEVIDVSLIELAALKDKDGNSVFTDEQLTEFAGSIVGKFGTNPKSVGSVGNGLKPYDKFKCQVLDLEFFSYNDQVYRTAPDSKGNADFRKAEYFRKSDKYMRKRFQVVYKVKWIVGTDFAYDFELCHDMKRVNDPKKKAYTSLSYKFFALNFYEMKAQGMMERLIPYLDDYQLTMLKIQNFKNRAVPSGWWIDLDGLERTAMNKGGKNMSPKELLQMFFETGVLAGRSTDGAGNPMYQNSQPVIPIANTAASELQMFYQDLLSTIQAIETLTGYNAPTMGEANPKTLVPGYELAEQSTNDALYPLTFAETQLNEKLASDVLMRMQQGRKKGKVTGYAPYGNALNKNLLTFIDLGEGLPMRDYGVMLEMQTDNQEKMWIMQQVQGDIANGFLSTADAILIINTNNAKQAMSILSYRVKRAKEQAHQNQMQLVQEQGKQNMENAQATAAAEQQKVQFEAQVELQKEQMRIQGELQKEQMRLQVEREIALMKLQMEYGMNAESNETKIVVADKAAQAKIAAQQLSTEGDIIKTDLAGTHAQEKQALANKKPQKPAAK